MCLLNNKNSGFVKQFSCAINGIETEFVFHPFLNKWFLLIVQYGRVPNMYNVTFDMQRSDGSSLPAMQGPINNPQFHMSVAITIKSKFGADTDENQAVIQFLVNKTKLNRCPSEFVIGIGIKEPTGETLRNIAKVLDEMIL